MEVGRKRKITYDTADNRSVWRLRELLESEPSLINGTEIFAILAELGGDGPQRDLSPRRSEAISTRRTLDKEEVRDEDLAKWKNVSPEYKKASVSLRPINSPCSVPIFCTVPVSMPIKYEVLLQTDTKSFPLETDQTTKRLIEPSFSEEKNSLTLTIDLEVLYKNKAYHQHFNLTKSRVRYSTFSVKVKWFYGGRMRTSSSPEFQIIGRVRTQSGKAVTTRKSSALPPSPSPPSPSPRSLPSPIPVSPLSKAKHWSPQQTFPLSPGSLLFPSTIPFEALQSDMVTLPPLFPDQRVTGALKPDALLVDHSFSEFSFDTDKYFA